MKKFILFFLIFIVSKLSFSEIRVAVSDATPSKYDIIQLEVMFLNESKKPYKIIGIENFETLGTNTYENSRNINGQWSTIKRDVLHIKPKKDGNLNLTVSFPDGEFKSIDVKVTADPVLDKTIEEAVNVEIELPKKEYYFGERIPFQEVLINTVNILSINKTSNTVFNDFSVLNFPVTNANKNITYKNKPAAKNILSQGIIQPNSSGEKIIKTSSYDARIAVNNSTLDTIVSGEDLKINIKPLPLGAPSDFKGTVGKITNMAKLNKTEVKVGEAVTVTVVFSGAGNLEFVEELTIEDNNNFNTYQNIISYTQDIFKDYYPVPEFSGFDYSSDKDNEYFNAKVFEIAFIPKNNTVTETPEIKISYFNTESGKYEEKKVGKFNIKVTGENPTNISPIKENMENKTMQPNKISDEAPNSSEIDITLLEKEKSSNKNLYKLGFLILLVIFLLQIILICYHEYNQKKKNNGKKR